MSEISVHALILCIMLMLPIAALVGWRVPWRTLMRMALAWILIFGVGLFLVSRLGGLMSSRGDGVVSGAETRIRTASDGHFWADVSINGVGCRMLIDTGATTTAISLDTARAARLDLDESPFAVPLQTANGPITARHATIASLSLGSIRAEDLPVVVSERFGTTGVLGMNLLSRLSAWRIEGDTLILIP